MIKEGEKNKFIYNWKK